MCSRYRGLRTAPGAALRRSRLSGSWHCVPITGSRKSRSSASALMWTSWGLRMDEICPQLIDDTLALYPTGMSSSCESRQGAAIEKQPHSPRFHALHCGAQAVRRRASSAARSACCEHQRVPRIDSAPTLN
jgi:hypothetical protein